MTARTWASRLGEKPVSMSSLVSQLERGGTPPADPRGGAVSPGGILERFPELADVRTVDLPVTGPRGPVPCRLYIPAGTAPEAAMPDLVWCHGGAFIGGDLDMPEAHWVSLELAHRGFTVVSTDYTKTLHGVKLPEPVDDLLAVWSVACARASAAGAPVPHLGGASAGAALAALTALRLRDEGKTAPASLILVYAIVHPQLPPIAGELLSVLDRVPAEQPLATPAFVEAMHRQAAAGVDHSKAFAGRAHLSGLPRALLLDAELDPMRSSGALFASQLADAGVPVESEVAVGEAHGFLNDPREPGALAALNRIQVWLRDTAEGPRQLSGESEVRAGF